MKLTEKQHRDQLAKAGLDATDIDTLVKAKCDAGDYADEDEGVEGDDDDAMEKAQAKYDADLKKAMELKVRDFATREPNTNATNPETRPPDERTEVPMNIDDVGDESSLTTDIVKGAYEAIGDIIKAEIEPVLAALQKARADQAALTREVREGNAIVKAQGALLKAQSVEIDKVRKATRKAAEQSNRALNRTPADTQPAAPSAGYKVVPEPGERRSNSGVSLDAVQNAIAKAKVEIEAKPAHQIDGRDRERLEMLRNASFDAYQPDANLAAIAAQIGLTA